MRIGIFGGTFNPPHLAHMHWARVYKRHFALDRVLIMPTNVPPHKQPSDLAPAENRLEMCKLAIGDDSGFIVCDYEIRRGGVSYTLDTLRYLKDEYPGADICLLMGADMFLSMSTWREPREIFRLVTLCACAREEGEYLKMREHQPMLESMGARCEILQAEPMPMSSTNIRHMIRNSVTNMSGCLHPDVWEYIKTRKLYGVGRGMNGILREPEALTYYVRARMSARRFHHSKCVAKRARELSHITGVDEHKAWAAGILHDICKEMPADEQLQYLKSRAILLPDDILSSKGVLHGFTGALKVQDELFIDDEDILNAIRYHTTARAGMSALEKTVFLADLTSADRDFSDLPQILKALEDGIDSAIAYSLGFKINKVRAKGNLVPQFSLEAYDEYKR